MGNETGSLCDSCLVQSDERILQDLAEHVLRRCKEERKKGMTLFNDKFDKFVNRYPEIIRNIKNHMDKCESCHLKIGMFILLEKMEIDLKIVWCLRNSSKQGFFFAHKDIAKALKMSEHESRKNLSSAHRAYELFFHF